MSLLMTEKAATYLQTHGGIGSAAAKANLSVFKVGGAIPSCCA